MKFLKYFLSISLGILILSSLSITPEKSSAEYANMTSRCQTLHDWFHGGTLTDRLNGNIMEASQCALIDHDWWEDPYGNDYLNNQRPTLPGNEKDRCELLHDWFYAGTLTARLLGDITEASECARKNHPWWRDINGGEYDPLFEIIDPNDLPIDQAERCDLLHRWYHEGTLTGRLGNHVPAIGCAQNNQEWWLDPAPIPYQRPFANVTVVLPTSEKSRCELLHKWFYEGTLTDRLHGDISPAYECSRKNHPWWRDINGGEYKPLFEISDPNDLPIDRAERCELLHSWYHEGTLTGRLGSHSAAVPCAQNNLRWWMNSAPNPYTPPFSDNPVNLPLNEKDRCELLHDWYYEGTLTDRLHGDILEASKCSAKNHRWWQDPSPGPFYPISPYAEIEIPPAGFEDDVRVKYKNEENPFPDTNIDSLEGIAAAELYRRAVIGGFPDGQFKGFQPVNRAEAAKFLLQARKAEGLHGAPLENPFWDVYEEDWYGPFVLRAAELGIIKGHPDGSFKPADGVLVAEFVKMLALSFDLPMNLPYIVLHSA